MAELCPYHRSIVKSCLAKSKHLSKAARRRLRADYASQCSPGSHGCPPLKETR